MSESKIMCGTCGTELVERPDCATTPSPSWCPKCQCYPTDISIGIIAFPVNLANWITVTQSEYNRLKKCETELARYKAEVGKIPKLCKHYDGWSCQGYQGEELGSPHICPNWEG